MPDAPAGSGWPLAGSPEPRQLVCAANGPERQAGLISGRALSKSGL